MSQITDFFKYEHLPPELQEVSKPLGDLANWFDHVVPPSEEKSAGMRKLLEAKDCFVRAMLPPAKSTPSPWCNPPRPLNIPEPEDPEDMPNACHDYRPPEDQVTQVPGMVWLGDDPEPEGWDKKDPEDTTG